MKNAGIILKSGIVAFTALVFCTAGYAQTNQMSSKEQQTVSVTPIEKSGHISQINNKAGQNVAKAKLNPNLAAQKRSAIQVSNDGNSARKCTTSPKENPFAISRSVFNTLPSDRQRFVLEHSNKYTIVD